MTLDPSAVVDEGLIDPRSYMFGGQTPYFVQKRALKSLGEMFFSDLFPRSLAVEEAFLFEEAFGFEARQHPLG